MALDKQVASDSLFGKIKKKESVIEEIKPKVALSRPKELETQKLEQAEESSNTKWESLERVTVVLTPQQKDGLDILAKQLMRNRPRTTLNENIEKERITANTVMRALVDILLEKGEFVNLPIVHNEEDVKAWLKSAIFKL